ncbi:MAG: phosphoribosylformylglycinamidine synthase subunit PurS [Acidobacteriota bacterium]
MKGKIYVYLKKKVLDPQGKAVENALKTLGFEEVKSVRVGKFFEIEADSSFEGSAEERMNEYCKKLLVNGVIEDFKVEVVEE